MLPCRIPVPWSEPKAQVVYGLVKSLRWDQEGSEHQKAKQLNFDQLFADELDIAPVYKTPPTTISYKRSFEQSVRDVLRWAVDKAIRKVDPPSESKPEVSSIAIAQAVWEPPTPTRWDRRRVRRQVEPKLRPPRSMVSTVAPKTQSWHDLAPPSLLAWAAQRGIKSKPTEKTKSLDPFYLDPFSTKSNVISLDHHRQVATALRRGEWCLVAEIDILPLSLKRWLIECNVRLIRYIGRRYVEGGGQISPVPVNGYVTEDGTTFYVAEDGVTFYVQEN